MCLPFCLPCLSLCSLLPLLWVIAMPIVGTFCGPDTLLRFSLLMMVYSLLESFTRRVLHSFLPVFSIAFFALIICLPVNVVPYPLVWLYGQLVWLTEPLILLVEALGVVGIVMRISRRVAAEIDDHPLLAKGLILGAAAGAYLTSILFAIYTYKAESVAIRGLLFVISIIALIHLGLTIKADHGIVSNCAVITMCMMGALYVGFYEANLVDHPLSEPKEWSDESYDLLSLSQILLSTATSSMSHITKATRFLSKLVNPAIILLVLVRAVSINQIVGWLVQKVRQSMMDEDSEMEEESYLEEVEIDDTGYLPATPACLRGVTPLPTKLCLVFIYTQLVCRTMGLSGGHRPYRALVPIGLQDGLQSALLEQVGLFRLVQIAVLGLVYPVRLRMEGEDEDEDW